MRVYCVVPPFRLVLAGSMGKGAGWFVFFGSLMIGFGPLATLWWTVVVQRSQLIVLAFSSAFFWLMGVLTLSIFQVRVFLWRHSSILRRACVRAFFVFPFAVRLRAHPEHQTTYTPPP